MLLEMLVNAALDMVHTLLSQIPDPGVVVTQGSAFILGYSSLNAALPLDTMITCLGLTVTILVATVPWHLGIYLYRLLPFKGT